jgi:hypothetical protein
MRASTKGAREPSLDFMAGTIHSATVRRPLRIPQPGGGSADIPPGPCLVEALTDATALIVWGDEGEFSAVIPTKALQHAVCAHDLLLLD